MSSSRSWLRGGESPLERSGAPPVGRVGGAPVTATATAAPGASSPASSAITRLSQLSPVTLACGAGALVASGLLAWQVFTNRRRLGRVRDALCGRPPVEAQMLHYVFEQAREGDAESVIAAIDEFCNAGHWMMNVGDVKGAILDAEVHKKQPAVAVELGSYCGYSALHIARLLPPGGHLYSIDVNPLHAAIATRIVDYAGLSSRVTFLVGTLSTRLSTLRSRGVSRVDLVFLDHLKSAYRPDLQLLEQAGLLATGSVIVADNCKIPGAPEYVAYIRDNINYESTCHETKLEYSDTEVDHVWVSIRKHHSPPDLA